MYTRYPDDGKNTASGHQRRIPIRHSVCACEENGAEDFERGSEAVFESLLVLAEEVFDNSHEMCQRVQELLVQPCERLCGTRKPLGLAFGFILLRPVYRFLSISLFVDFMTDLQAYEILINAIGKNDLGRLALGVHDEFGLARNSICLHSTFPA